MLKSHFLIPYTIVQCILKAFLQRKIFQKNIVLPQLSRICVRASSDFPVANNVMLTFKIFQNYVIYIYISLSFPLRYKERT